MGELLKEYVKKHPEALKVLSSCGILDEDGNPRFGAINIDKEKYEEITKNIPNNIYWKIEGREGFSSYLCLLYDEIKEGKLIIVARLKD